MSHFGIRYGTFEQLEQVLSRLDSDTRTGAPLAGRVKIYKRILAPGHSAAVDVTSPLCARGQRVCVKRRS